MLQQKDCSVSPLNIPTVRIGNIFKVPDIVSNVMFTCTPTNNYYPQKPGERIAYCWHIHNGGGGKGYNVTGYRGASFGNNTIWFNFYAKQINLGSEPVGTIERPYNIYGLATQTAPRTWSVNDPVTLRFEHNESALNLPAGHYTYDNPQLHVVMTLLRANEALTKNLACYGGDASDSGNSNAIGQALMGDAHVDLNIETSCEIEPNTQLNFGKQMSLQKPLTASVDVHVDCSGGTDFDASIDNGLHYDNGSRRMQKQIEWPDDPVAYINYSIDTDHWSGCGRGTDMASAPFQTINGTVPVQPNPVPGTYRDTLKITVVYRNNFSAAGGQSDPYCKNQGGQ